MKRLIGYIRVSTEQQAEEGVSLEAQQKRIEQYVALHDDKYKLIGVEVDSLSAKTLERPGLQRILTALVDKEADGVIIVKLDRLTRRVADLGYLVDNYFSEQHKHILVSVNEHIDTLTAGGRLMLNILASVAQWERETIAERTKDALTHLRNKGVKLGGAPLGLERTDDVDAEGRRVLRENEEEKEIVDDIMKMYRLGVSLNGIARAMNQEGRKTKRGGKWHAETIRLIVNRMEGEE